MPVYAMLVAWLVAVTVTPGTAAPDESATSPVTVASPVCPTAGVAKTSPPSATRPTRRTMLRSARIGFPFSARGPSPGGDDLESAGVVPYLLQRGVRVHYSFLDTLNTLIARLTCVALSAALTGPAWFERDQP